MTEKQKMLNEQLYDASDPILCKERDYARRLIFKYNKTYSAQVKKRTKILRKLFGGIQKGTYIDAPFSCDYGYNITSGINFYANFGCVILDVNKVTIGNNVLFGPNVHIYTAGHPVDPVERATLKEFGKAITIGNNVWVGGMTVLCPGVSIGDNTVIGAGSVVTKDIPANVVAAGNPCRIIKKL